MTRISLRAPVLFLVLSAIALPIELLPLGKYHPMDVHIDFSAHAFVNVLGFVPVGLVLGEFGLLRAVVAAGLMSGLAETGQMMMLNRDPSVSDFLTNVLGAFLGAALSVRWEIRAPAFRINRWTTLIAALLALGLMAHIWSEKGPAVSARGSTAPGTLEAFWKLDENGGRVAVDSSPHGLSGKFNTEPARIFDAMGTSTVFDGKREYINVGPSTALRLAGSMTITAWINSSSFPFDDAAIVSQLHEDSGYQFDTTVDNGPRTIGFKLRSACGNLMARYGATPLVVDTWYHVTGVYNAPKRTLDVYLNGKPDNGILVGPITSTQHNSRWPVYIGRRSDSEGFGFAGLIRDVRIYSFALTNDQIAAVMRGQSVRDPVAGPTVAHAAGDTSEAGPMTTDYPHCAVVSEDGDQWIPLMAASLGVVVAIACSGLWPSAGSQLCVLCSLASGLLLVPAISSNVPSFNLWLIPLISLAGGVSVVISTRRYTD